MTAKIAPSRPWAYFDSSALVKRYVDEAGRQEVRKLMRRHQCVVSVLAPVELRSAFRRRVSEKTLDAAHLPALLTRLAADRPYWTFVGLNKEVLASAEEIVAVYPIRALDAIHVASARLFAARLPDSRLKFIGGDARQVDTASALGILTQHV